MDWLTFTTKIVESTAWPLCAIIIALLFKNQLSELLSRIVKGKIPGGEFEFSDVAKGQLATADQSIAPPQLDYDESGSGSASLYSLDTAYELLDTLPRAAVIEGWRQLNAAAADRVVESYEESSESSSSSGYPEDYPFRHIPTARLAGCLRSRSILTSDQLALFDELRRLRNQAVHDDETELDEKKAEEYLILAELLLDKLRY
ncbi:MAG: hypothetical protein R3C01_15105 [Planctomycetaceae bacterium]